MKITWGLEDCSVRLQTPSLSIENVPVSTFEIGLPVVAVLAKTS